MNISEKVAYIKGLADGLGLGDDTKEGKVLVAILDVLSDMADEIAELDENQLDIGDELDAISEDLSDVEEYIFGDEDEDDICDGNCCCCDEDDDCCCDDEDDDCCCDEDDDCCCSEEDLEFEATCPDCGADIALSEADLNKGSIVCPSCGETLEFEFDGVEEDEE